MAKPDRGDDVTLNRGRGLVLGLTVALVGGLSAALLTLPANTPRLAETALSRTPESGVLNPVTAVLLNFRGYDTLLEVAVLLLAIIGIWSMARQARVWIKLPDTPVLATFVRLVLPLMVIVGGYLLWLGADLPGGAFQGGAVLGGLGVLWVAAAVWLPPAWFRRLLRPALIVGLLAFLLVAVAVMFPSGLLLAYPPEQAKNLILLVESAAVISIGVTLTLLFIGGIPTRGDA